MSSEKNYTVENKLKLIQQLDEKYLKLNEPMSKHTTIGIGGPADIWFEAQTTEEFIKTIKLSRELNIPLTIIGRGSNSLVSDNGIRGLVLKNSSKNIVIGNDIPVIEDEELDKKIEDEEKQFEARWQSDSIKGTFQYEFKDLNYDESNEPKIEVVIDSGVDMPIALNYLISKGITGLQWYARIPGNLGGWVYNNVHGGTHFLDEVIKSVQVLDENQDIITLNHDDLKFGYDESRFHSTCEIILNATLNLYKGDRQRAQYTAIEWATRKSKQQPPKSPGCTFANITIEQKENLKYPTTSVGYVIEHVLKMTGYRVGDAAISLTHHNFIENKGNATAKDFLAVVKEIQNRSAKQIGFKLTPEIFFFGFTQDELKDIQPAKQYLD